MYTITLPQLDENVTEYTVSKWLKQAGDSVAANEPILEVDTDKVTMEVVAEQAGTLGEHFVAVGDVLTVGKPLTTIDANGSAPVSEPHSAPPAEIAQAAPSAPSGTVDLSKRASPVVARMLAEHDLTLAEIDGTGRGGRVTKKDVEAYLARQSTAPAVADQPTADGGGTLQPLTGMRRSIAEHMVRSVHTTPHVTTVFEFDFAAVTAHRRAHKAAFAQEGIKLTYMAYIMQATASALRQFPLVNSVFRGLDQGIELKNEINIGLIVAVENGLFNPVVMHADRLNLRGTAAKIGELAERARSGGLKSADFQNGTFTISNHGASGSLMGTPIIYQPQVGILGVGAIEQRIKVIDGAIHIRPMAYISFSFDHRIMDGALADGFVNAIKRQIETWPL